MVRAATQILREGGTGGGISQDWAATLEACFTYDVSQEYAAITQICRTMYQLLVVIHPAERQTDPASECPYLR